MIQLFVEKQAVDINESFSTLLTMSIDDIKDFGAKNTTFSKTIVLPGTKNNNKLFGNIFNINARNDYNPAELNVGINFNPAISADAIIFADNLQVFKGVFRILEIVIEDDFIEYECAVFGELGGFVAALANKKIEELDFSAYNTAWNYTNITASWNTIAGAGLYFPLIDYGAASTNKTDFNFDTFRPALYVRQILEKMITASGYTWEFPALSSALFNRLIVPHNQKNLYRYNSTAFQATPTTTNYLSAQPIVFTVSTLGDFTPSGGNTIFTYGGASAITTNIILEIDAVINAIDPVLNTFRVNLQKNGTTISTAADVVSYTPGYATILILSVNNITINPADTLSVQVSANVGDYSINTGTLFQIELTTPGLITIGYGDTIIVNDTIPKGIFQREFFSTICKMFNLYVFEDYETDKKLRVLPFVTFYEDATSVDWSLKVDRSKPMRIKPMAELNSRYYNYKFKQDNDFYSENYRKKFNEGYGDFIFDTEFEFAKETTSVELIFANSVLTKFTGKDKIFSSIYKLSNSNNSEDRMDSVIRIMQAKKMTGVGTWNILNVGSSVGSQTVYGYAGHIDDPITPTFDLCFSPPQELSFEVSNYTPNNLFNDYWDSYMAEITDKDSRLLTCTMKLAFKDIYKLDFAKLIWIDGVLYRLNKITDFNATSEDVCNVELLKIINRIY
jgi:hypothetical protein